MKIPPLFAHVAVFIGAALVAAFASASAQEAQSAVAAPEAQRARELIHIVRQDCGSCHGLTLAGGLGPALTPDVLADKPFEGLVATVFSGRPGTPMPPFRSIVSEAEAQWIVDQLMRGFPPDEGLPPAR
ncbi:c-type cytochrome [Thauera sp. Sel9]|uniref:c-type cytochrome n=1 Tax=Thauera sp. Sel9 TaxID=2974299 RepID=UPI0021E12337|nr:cytochrome c [Thauera sp. Sel9]MCV2219066.1 cytochrome c [Thauera sp. Sel9]